LAPLDDFSLAGEPLGGVENRWDAMQLPGNPYEYWVQEVRHGQSSPAKGDHRRVCPAGSTGAILGLVVIVPSPWQVV